MCCVRWGSPPSSGDAVLIDKILNAGPPTGDPIWSQRRRLATAIRRIISLLVSSEAPADQLRVAADAAQDFAESLAAHPQGLRVLGYGESSNSGDVRAFFDQSPLIGLSNALAPPLHLSVRDGRVCGKAHFGAAYEGPPGCVHGGFVAASFDEVLGFTQSLGGNPGMTGTLTVRYRNPTPLHTDLVFDAGVDRVEGRKTFTSGTLWAGDMKCADADGLFIAVNAERYQKLIEEAERRR